MFVYVAVALWRAIQGKCHITSPSSPALTREPCLPWSVHNSSFSLSLSIISSFSLALNLCFIIIFMSTVITEAWKNLYAHTHTHTTHACVHKTPHHTTPHMHACTHTHTHTHTPHASIWLPCFSFHTWMPLFPCECKCWCGRSKMLALCPTGVVQWEGGLHPNVLHCGGADWIIPLSELLPQWSRQPTVVYSWHHVIGLGVVLLGEGNWFFAWRWRVKMPYNFRSCAWNSNWSCSWIACIVHFWCTVYSSWAQRTWRKWKRLRDRLSDWWTSVLEEKI